MTKLWLKINEIDNIISAQKMVSGQIICVDLNAHVDINFGSTWDRNMYLQPCIDTENCQT